MLIGKGFAGLLFGGLVVFTCQTMHAEDKSEDLIGPPMKVATAPPPDAADSRGMAGPGTITSSLVPDAPEWMLRDLTIHVPLSDTLGRTDDASLIVTVTSEGDIQIECLREAAAANPLGLEAPRSVGVEALRKPLLLTADGWALAP